MLRHFMCFAVELTSDIMNWRKYKSKQYHVLIAVITIYSTVHAIAVCVVSE